MIEQKVLNKIFIGLETNIGGRKKQQDAAVASTNDKEESTVRKTIAVLCDGMGGMSGGELASNLCVNQIYNSFYDKGKIDDYHTFLLDEIDKADNEVSNLQDEDGNKIEAGTTLVAVIIEDNRLYWASVGDSRLYIIRNNEILQMTTDHNYYMQLMEQVKEGKLTKEQADKNPQKEALISYVGIKGIRYIDSNKKPFELMPDDCLILCSDGMYRTLTDENLKEIIDANGDNMPEAAKHLIEEALKMNNPRQDNLTVITIKYL